MDGILQFPNKTSASVAVAPAQQPNAKANTTPNTEVVEMLEALLAEAKGGQIESFVIVLDRGNGSWAERASGVRDVFRTIGMLQLALHGGIHASGSGN